MTGTGKAQLRDAGRLEDRHRSEPAARALLREALAGGSLTVDREALTLHELTQIALALRPGAELTVAGGKRMSPLEQASVATVGRGRVSFL